MIPNHAEKITIVGIQTIEEFNWYVTDEVNDYDWILDLNKLIKKVNQDFTLSDRIFNKNFVRKLKLDKDKIVSQKHGYTVIDDINIHEFLPYLQDKIISAITLRSLMKNIKTFSEASSLLPVLYIDFSKKILLSDSDFTAYELFAPRKWTSKAKGISYKNFEQYIPLDKLYWLENGLDLFEEIEWEKLEDYIE
ncbi:hypothetical protein RyT2_29490 [Pseudolactococcus yaeyamensis]